MSRQFFAALMRAEQFYAQFKAVRSLMRRALVTLLACAVLLAPSIAGGWMTAARADGGVIADAHNNLSALVNQPYSGPVATFTDTTTNDGAASFQVVQISWGDGSALDTSSGSVSGATGYFAIRGVHTYTTAGNYPLDVRIAYAGTTMDLTGIALVASCTPPGGLSDPYVQAVLATGPLGYWRLDDSGSCAADSTSHNLPGMVNGGVTSGQAGALPGDAATSFGFDGQSGYVSLGDPTSLQPGSLSVEAWITSTQTGAYATIVRKRYYGYGLALNANGTPTFGINDSNAVSYNATGPTSVADGKWHYLVGTYDGGQVCLYVDGVAAGSCQSAKGIYYQPDTVAIGRDGGASSSYFNGRINEVAIYGRALNATEIHGHFTAATAPITVSCTPTPVTSLYSGAVLASTPLGYWRLNETCVGIVHDASGHGLSGEAFGGVTPGHPGPLHGNADASMSFENGYVPDVELGDATALQPATVSVEAWVNTRVAQPYQNIIVRKRSYGYALYENPYVGNGTCGCTAGFSITDRNGTTYAADGTVSIADGQWHYLVGTYDGGKVCFYMDGALVNCTPAGTIYYQPDLVAIGQDGSSIPPRQYYTPQFYGLISEVAIYGHALSPTEVHAHFTAATVIPTTTTTTTLASSTTTAVANQPVTLTATVRGNGGIPTGSVTFTDGATTLGTGTLTQGVATFTTTALAVATHTLAASYSGDTTFSTSAAKALSLVINKAQTSTTVSSNVAPSSPGTAVTFTANVRPVAPGAGMPTGAVTFKDGASVLTTAMLSHGQASFTTSTLTPGTHSITTSYAGDGAFNGGTSAALSQVVNKAQTTTTVMSNNNPANQGAPVTLTATVRTVNASAGTPIGTVTIMDGSTAIGTVMLASGQAAIRTSSLTAGSHSITVVYSGTSTFAGSTSPAITQRVLQHF